MARTTCVTATYRPNGTGEIFQVAVEVPTSFPDVVDEARSQAVRGGRRPGPRRRAADRLAGLPAPARRRRSR